MDIVTGFKNTAHITSWQDRDLNQGIFGSDTYILGVGSKLAATIISNNEIHIADGVIMMQGCQGVVQKGTYDTISIDNGSQGMLRKDLICIEYTKVSGTGVESLAWKVVKGTPAASSPSDPSVTSGDIQNGDSPVQVPIYRVSLNGLTVESVNALVDTLGDTSGIVALQTAVGVIGDTYENSTPTNVSVPSATLTGIISLNLPAGTYVVNTGAYFGSSASAQKRYITLNNTYVLGNLNLVIDAIRSSSGINPSAFGTFIYEASTSFTLQMRAYQDTGSAVNVSGYIAAVRIK